MLQNREPYKSAFKLLTFLGCWDEISTAHKRWVLKIPLASAVILAILSSLSLLQAQEYNDALTAFEIVPVILLILVSLSDVIRKKNKITRMFEIIHDIEAENPEISEHIDRACRLNSKISMASTTALITTYSVFAIFPLLTDKLSFPIYIPEFCRGSTIAFYFLWVFENYSAAFCSIMFLVLYEFRNSLFVLLIHVMEFYRAKLRSLKPSELQKCIRIHLQIKE
jgi:hypothetical protein